MVPSNHKTVIMFPPQSIASNATVTGSVDTLGYDYAIVKYSIGAAASTSGAAVMSVRENTSATTGSAATWSGNTTTSFTTVAIAGATTESVLSKQWNVDLRGRMRYLIASFTPNTDGTALAACWAELYRAEEAPVSTTQHNVRAIANA